ncbi:phage portal protein [Andreesenia angusta]|uniref:Phage portal protein n=1 Tax=Andreesenia angusta TaxID=39480 RepID=A0A1S1V6S2_9FIRM|nr:phage portal protein [Andreesenia angusta]OHW61389.1 phage portal protein [Andreesenia angusta]
MKIRSIFDRFKVEKRTATTEETTFGSMGLLANETITPKEAFGNIGVVFACVERRANALAKLPVHVFKKTNEGRVRDSKHRLDYLLTRRPNKYQTPSAFKKYIVVSQLLWGNAYVKMVYGKNGAIEELIPLDPSVTKLIKKNGEYWIQTNEDNKNVVYAEEEVIHLPYISIDGKEGKAPLTVARESATNIRAKQEFESNFYKNGTLVKGALKVPSQLSKEAKKKVKEEWRELYGGTQNTGDIAVLDAGIEWQNISLPLKDAEYVLSKKLSSTEIANIFNVPSFLLNDMERSTFNNIEHQNMRFILDVIQSDCIAIEEEINYKAFTERESNSYVKFILTSSLRGDSASRVSFYKEMIGMGIFSINDVRELEDRNSIGELGDKHYFSLNYTTLDTLEGHQRIKKGGENDEPREPKSSGEGAKGDDPDDGSKEQ